MIATKKYTIDDLKNKSNIAAVSASSENINKLWARLDPGHKFGEICQGRPNDLYVLCKTHDEGGDGVWELDALSEAYIDADQSTVYVYTTDIDMGPETKASPSIDFYTGAAQIPDTASAEDGIKNLPLFNGFIQGGVAITTSRPIQTRIVLAAASRALTNPKVDTESGYVPASVYLRHNRAYSYPNGISVSFQKAQTKGINEPVAIIGDKHKEGISFVEFEDVFVSEVEENTDTAPANDPVNRPAHYTSGKIEVIDFIEDQKLNYHLGNTVKYISRAGKKDPALRKQDLQKALWYLTREINNIK